jgi:exodeoxyribonuclease VII small subunit
LTCSPAGRLPDRDRDMQESSSDNLTFNQALVGALAGARAVAASDNLTFEQALVELDKIVRDLEDGHAGLEVSLARYQQGVGLLRACYEQLRSAEKRILLLNGEDGDGRPITSLFEHAATLEMPNAETTRQRKKIDEDGKY